MITKVINTKKNEGSKFFKFNELQLGKFNVIVGKNGSGKSSLLRGLQGVSLREKFAMGIGAHFEKCSENLDIETNMPTKIECYTSRENNGKYRGYFDNDMDADIQCLFASEGQSNIISFVSFFKKITAKLKADPSLAITVLIDELESGLSPNNVNVMTLGLIGFSEVESRLQIIMTTNNWETLRTVKDKNITVIDAYKGITVECPQTYDEFFELYK